MAVFNVIKISLALLTKKKNDPKNDQSFWVFYDLTCCNMSDKNNKNYR